MPDLFPGSSGFRSEDVWNSEEFDDILGGAAGIMLEICINNTGILTPINSVLRGPYNYMVKYTASSDVKSLHVGSVNAKGTSKM